MCGFTVISEVKAISVVKNVVTDFVPQKIATNFGMCFGPGFTSSSMVY